MNNLNALKNLFALGEQTEQKSESTFSKLELQAIQNAINMLSARGCTYTVILPNGEKYSNMPEKKTRKKYIRTQSFKEYVNPILDKLNVNDFITVPFDKYDGLKLQANLCARAYARWGSKSIMTSIDREKKVVELIREK
tara:strand:+ start:64 stop:480 length:417 start_codon:yes stop_codon:yes gene_type:complete